MSWTWLLSLNLMNQHLLASNFSSSASSPLSAFIELKRVRALRWIWLQLKGILWLVWSIQSTRTFSLSAIRQFHFLIIHVFTGGGLLSYFKNFSFAFRLAVWCKRPSFQPILSFNMPSSLSLIVSSFFLFQLRPFTWILIVHYKIMNWPGFNTVLSQETETLEKREHGQMVEQSEHAFIDYWLSYMGTVCGSSNQLQ